MRLSEADRKKREEAKKTRIEVERLDELIQENKTVGEMALLMELPESRIHFLIQNYFDEE